MVSPIRIARRVFLFCPSTACSLRGGYGAQDSPVPSRNGAMPLAPGGGHKTQLFEPDETAPVAEPVELLPRPPPGPLPEEPPPDPDAAAARPPLADPVPLAFVAV